MQRRRKAGWSGHTTGYITRDGGNRESTLEVVYNTETELKGNHNVTNRMPVGTNGSPRLG